MNKLRFISVIALVLLSACASIPQRKATYPGIENSKLNVSWEMLAQVKAMKKCPQRLKVEASLTVEMEPKFSSRKVKLVLMARPGHLRANGLGPLGIKAFDLAYRPGRLAADIPLKKSFLPSRQRAQALDA